MAYGDAVPLVASHTTKGACCLQASHRIRRPDIQGQIPGASIDVATRVPTVGGISRECNSEWVSMKVAKCTEWLAFGRFAANWNPLVLNPSRSPGSFAGPQLKPMLGQDIGR